MKSSITKRWVRGSLLFTLAVVFVAEGLFLFFMISGYYNNVRSAIQNQFGTLQAQLSLPSTATTDERYLRLIRTVEQFEAKSQFELTLIRSNGSIAITSTGVMSGISEPSEDIEKALSPGEDTGEFVGENENGERIMAITTLTPYSAGDIVAMRLSTSIELVEDAIFSNVLLSVLLVLAIILASVISGVYFIRSIVLPLQKVEASAARIAQGDFETRVSDNAKDEIGRLCQTINNMAEELSKTERMKNTFISSVSHELRTPLTSIKGWTETVNRLSDPKSPSFRRGLDIISSETDRLYDMVEELLDFSRMQDGLSLECELLDIAAEVEAAVILSEQRAAELGVKVLYAPPELPLPVMADKNRLKQTLVNVLDNAIKYSFVGSAVQVSVQREQDSINISVKDEGQGISPEDIEHVKERFYKGKSAVRGSGIGLAVADEIMCAHGGTLQLQSELGKGTNVILTFPAYKKQVKTITEKHTKKGENV